jgi:hypothetical protein
MAKTNSKQLSGVENIELTPDGSIVIKLNQTPALQTSFTKEIQFEKDRISQTEAASLFKVSIQTIINWSKKGIINKYKLGNRVFYLKSELLESARCNKQMVKV